MGAETLEACVSYDFVYGQRGFVGFSWNSFGRARGPNPMVTPHMTSHMVSYTIQRVRRWWSPFLTPRGLGHRVGRKVALLL